ncbi:transglycosylase domain-containing protein, partial [Akkermansiaceae bacterium]|nr:transglycosylase domain-containing protein [Akkermansiaceae bacterium]
MEKFGLISRRNNVTYSQLIKWNKISDPSLISIGQELIVSETAATKPVATATPAPSSKPAPKSFSYTISRGDTFYGIARKNGISLGKLTALNPGVDPSRIVSGQKLKVSGSPAPAVRLASTPTKKATAKPAPIKSSTTALTRIEKNFTKDEILTHYLNRIYFGAGCHGLEEASLTYFGKEASQLNRSQSAMLAGIIRAPHACSPFRNLEGALRQRDEVLARMVSLEQIGGDTATKVKAEPLELRDPDEERPSSSHAERALRRPLEMVLDQSQITEGGLRVTSSLDRDLQKSLETELNSLPLPRGSEVAGIAIDPRNGDILAIVGCLGNQPSGFNRALDMRRDLGSEMVEPLIATAALERGHVPVNGKPISTGRQLGDTETIRLLKRYGLEGQFGKGDDLYRGNLTVSPLELATSYATILQGGQRPAPCFVRGVEMGGSSLFH